MTVYGIHAAILTQLKTSLTAALITNVSDTASKAGLVIIGPHQEEPAPDEARIVAMIFANDPDAITGGAPTGLDREVWADKIEYLESNGTITHSRRFTVKVRCMFSRTREDQVTSLSIADQVRDRIEKSLLSEKFSSVVTSNGEYVSRGVFSDELHSELLQAGGPPDQYDYIIKFRFSVLTTRTGVS
jgi:hypothetical protein